LENQMPDNGPDQQQMQSQAQPSVSDSTQTAIPAPDQSQPAAPQNPLTAALQPNVQPTTSDSSQQQIPQNQAPQNQQNQPVQSPAPDPRDQHPAVQRASILHRVAQTLAGGPQTKTTYDADTGAVTREKVPLTNQQILTGAVSNILAGIGDIGTNLSDRMAGRRPQPIGPLPTQVAQQKQAAQSKEDFETAQQQKIVAAKVLNANLENQRLSYGLRHAANDVLDDNIKLHANDLTNYNGAGLVEVSQVPSSQILKKGYDPSKYMAIPDGHTPAIGSDGRQVTDKNGNPVEELTYSIVNGTTQVPLSQDDYDKFSKYGLMKGAKDGFKVPEGATVSGSTQALMNYKIGLYDQTEREVNQVREAAGLEPINIASEIKKNPGLGTSIESWHNDAASNNPADQYNTVKGVHPNAAGSILNLMGGDSALQKYQAKNQGTDFKNVDEARKKLADDSANVKVNGDGTVAYTGKDSGVQDAANYLNLTVRQERGASAGKTADDLKAKQAAETNSGDVQETARNIVGGDLAQLNDVVSRKGEDRRAMMNAILDEAKKQGKDPADFSPTALKTKSEMYQDYRQGKTSNNIAAFDAFLGHANDAMDANDSWRRSGSPLINKSLSWLAKNATNDTNYIAFDTSLEPVRKEFMSFLNANRAEHAEDLKTMQTVLNTDNSPAQIETALKQLGKSADIRLAAIGRKYQNTMGTPFPNLVSDEGKQTLARMGINSKSVGQASQQTSSQNGQKPATQNSQGGFDWNNLPKVQQ
jgi:hypothetical protein